MTCVFSGSLTADWQQLAQPRLANVQRAPQQRDDVDREERVAEQQSPDAELTGDRAAEVTPSFRTGEVPIISRRDR